MYDTNENNMWPQHEHQHQHQHQHQRQLQLQQLMAGPMPLHQPPSRPSPGPGLSSAASALRRIDAHVNHQRLDNHQPPQQHPLHRHGVMDLPVPSNPRASRNMAEKQRRDNLNMNISTMASLVPAVAGSSRRMDKISILRLSAAFLRSYYTLGPGPNGFLPQHYNDFDLEQHIIENVVASAGFFLVVTTSGKIVYISRQVEHQLGHAQHELLGQSLYNFICPEDYEDLQRGLTPDEAQPSANANPVRPLEDSSSSSDDPASPKSEKKFTEQRRSFNIRMSQKALNKRDHGQYECLHVSGLLRLADACLGQGTNNGGRLRHREVNATSNDVVFVGIARLLKRRTITELSLLEATKDEYVTRHLVDGRIIFCDHRISVVAGYMAAEVSGLSAFKFMHREDVRWTMIGLRQMYDRGEGFGSSCYRLLSKTGKFIYLRTHGYLEYDKNTQSVESFVCVNTLVPEKEGIELVKEMKKRFSATISGGSVKAMSAPSGSTLLPVSEESQSVDPLMKTANADELENAITHLISDLPSPCALSSSMASSPLPNNQYYKAAVYSQGLPPAGIQASKIGIESSQCRPSLSDRDSSDDCSEFPRRRRGAVALPGEGEKEVASADEDPRPGRESPFRKNSESRSSGSDCGQERRTTSSRKRASRNAECRKFFNAEKSDDGSASSSLMSYENAVPPRPHRTDSTVSSSCEMLRMPSNDSDVLAAFDYDDSARCSRQYETLAEKAESEEAATGVRAEEGEEVDAIGEGSRRPRKRSRSVETLPGPVALKRKPSEMNGIRRSRGDFTRTNGDVVYYRSEARSSTMVARLGPPDRSPISGMDVLVDEINSPAYRSADQQSPEGGGGIGVGGGGEISSTEVVIAAPSGLPAATIENLYQHSNATLFSDSSVSGAGQIDDFHEDYLEDVLSSSLEADPDFITRNFEDLPAVVYDEQSIDQANVNQFTANDEAVNEKIRRTHFELKKSIALRESQMSVLKRDLDNPALQANFTKLEAEHNEHKQMLQTLQQEHRNLQANVQHDIGV